MASGWVGTTPPEARELRACGLAALAEAGVLVLPVWLVLTEARGLKIGVVALAVPFVAAYVVGALLACRFRASRNVAFGAAMLAVLSGIWLGHGDLNRIVFSVLVCLLVSFRLVTLALRDWRVPIHAEVGWFALALGFEVLLAAGATDEWRGPLLLFVPLFFVAALASRASTVWTSGGAGELDERVRAAWIRRALIATGALVGAMAAAVILSVEGGVFDRIGVWLTPAANAVASFFAWVLSQAARPIFFLVDLLGIDPERVREFFDRLREGAAARTLNQRRAGPPEIWQRMLGFLVFAAIGYAVFRAIRHFRPPAGSEPEVHIDGRRVRRVVQRVGACTAVDRAPDIDAVAERDRVVAVSCIDVDDAGGARQRLVARHRRVEIGVGVEPGIAHAVVMEQPACLRDRQGIGCPVPDHRGG